ncbi:haloacid dehalogenase type II [Methylocella tundrae]|uniref:Haloacid dehalogenase type II n=1 Tax=Methylocella tundrae TaxID=227605 RepID=A0A4U8Z3S6_METTU|nr:haloacid dehalogenase type II [Methylocella tundrae]WPP03910.1 haloacid dehalogenase type II [Methylocella tundrae]VFU10115.1 Haloacid dehalogenase type II [Methylocella tundrae]
MAHSIGSSRTAPGFLAVKALFFDVFGTLVDWRGGVASQAEAILTPFGYALDWLAFADAWRGEYQTGMEEVRSGRIPFSKLDVIHRRNLDRILPRFGLEGAPEAALTALNLAWHRLPAWPDAARGLAKLRETYILAPMSNGNISLLVDLARHNDFVFDAIFGAEFAGDYKPKPGVYLKAAAALDLPPSACLMVATHSSDLAAAAACGLRTAHIARPDEFGTGGAGEARPLVPVDLAAAGIGDLARLLGLASR